MDETSFRNEEQSGSNVYSALVKEGTVPAVKKAEKKRTPLLANLGELNRPLRVRPVRIYGREWWAVDGDDTWPGMVMDLRRLGFESMAWGEEVLVREGGPVPEPQMDGPAALSGLKPFPTIQATIRIRREDYVPPIYSDFQELEYLDEDEDDEFDESELEPEDLDNE